MSCWAGGESPSSMPRDMPESSHPGSVSPATCRISRRAPAAAPWAGSIQGLPWTHSRADSPRTRDAEMPIRAVSRSPIPASLLPRPDNPTVASAAPATTRALADHHGPVGLSWLRAADVRTTVSSWLSPSCRSGWWIDAACIPARQIPATRPIAAALAHHRRTSSASPAPGSAAHQNPATPSRIPAHRQARTPVSHQRRPSPSAASARMSPPRSPTPPSTAPPLGTPRSAPGTSQCVAPAPDPRQGSARAGPSTRY